ncbi:MAG: PilC/PilY family type IV pilus protein [Rhodanobacter lindaniclasticus]
MSNRQFSSGRVSSALMGAVLTALGGLSAPAQVPTTLSVMALVAAGSSFVSAPASAATAATSNIVELSPTPPNVTQAVPPNIVVTFDNSGSMYNNYMGDNRPFDSGSWGGPWRCAGVIDPRITSSSDVRSKAMNGVYYNPNVVYSPPVKADGSVFPNADKTMAAVWLDGISINRPYSPVTAGTISYRNNPNGSSDPSGLTDLTGTITYRTTVTYFATFGTTCAANADAGSCQTNTSDTSSGGTHRFWTRNVDDTSGSGISTVYSGTSLRTRDSSSSGYTRRDGDKTSATESYATWTVSVTDTSQVDSDNRWKCGYGSSPMDGTSTDSDGNTYPVGGPYYYRYKSTAPTITVDSYGDPDSAGRTNLYNSGNWEAVAVPDTTVTIGGKSVNQWQNFANWYAYYRTRNLMTRTALSRVFGSLGSTTQSGGFGNSIRVAWQVLKNDDFLLPDTAIITSLLDDAGCDASATDPLATQQQSGTVKTPPSCYRSAFFNWMFQIYGNNDTPNRAATIRAGKFFQRGNGNTGGTGDLHDPYWDPPKTTGADGLELVCRQNYHMLVTDGYWNESNNYSTTGMKDSVTATTLPDGTAYSVSNAESRVFWDIQGTSQYTPSLADIAFNYWATNLRPDLYKPAQGKIVPPYMPDTATGIITGATSTAMEKYFNPKNDPANWPHLVQYMVTLGVPGQLIASDDADCKDSNNDLCLLRRGQTNSSGATGWTKPWNNNPTAIDDTWHAAINSRGAYFNAANPQNLVDQLTNILTNISARNVPATTSALNTSVLVQGAIGFTAGYSSGDWTGLFQAITANEDGTVSGLQWDAGTILTDATKTPPANRQILSAKEKADGSFDGGTAFRTFTGLDNLTASTGSSYLSAQTLLSGLPASTGSTDTGQARLDYLRGSRALEGTVYRTRSSLLGAIINSQALYVGAPSSGYHSGWPSGSPEALAMQNDGSTCVQSAPTLTTCHSYEAFAKIYQDRTPAVYVGANDGMLHAFNAKMVLNSATPPVAVPDADAGKEMFAYVPRTVFPNLGNLTAKSNFKFAPTVDATPVTRDVFFAADTSTPAVTTKGWHTLLVGGLRLGGRGVYALDITNPGDVTEANANQKVLWEFNADTPAVSGVGDPADLGYTFGQPNIGRLANGKWVVLVPGGYFPDCSKSDRPPNCVTLAAASKGYSALFVLDAQTGTLLRELKTLTTISGVSSGGLSSVVLGDYNNDQIDDVAFAGDLNGNLWRFDLTDPNPANWQAHVTLAFKPATQGDQPITVMPRLFPDPATNRFIVVFGTGKYLGADDNTSTSAKTQSIYGIRDKLDSSGNPITAVKADLQQQTLYQAQSANGLNTLRGLTDNSLTLAQNGWYIDLNLSSAPGERMVVTAGALFNTNRAIITTLIPGSQDPCSATIGGALMVLNAATGGSDGGLSSPADPTGGWTTGVHTVGGLVNNPPTGGSVPVASVIGGGKLLIPGLELQGGGNLNIDDAIWRRRSWRELNNDL